MESMFFDLIFLKFILFALILGIGDSNDAFFWSDDPKL